MCPTAAKTPSLQWFGYAADGVGFYAMEDLAPLEVEQQANLAYILVDDHKALVEVIEDGLKKLVCEDWNGKWKSSVRLITR